MTTLWDAEVSLNEDQASKLIELQFPDLIPVRIRELGKGFDNTVFQVNEEFVFRFPRRKVSVALLKTETNLLPKLHPLLNLPIPDPVFIGKPTESFPWVFTGFRFVRGYLPGIINEKERLNSVKPMARFLSNLHAFPIQEAERLGVPFDQFDRLSIEKRKPRMMEYVKKLESQIELELVNKLNDYIHTLKEVAIPKRQVLVHGDIHIRNMLVDEGNVICGVIDWGDAHIGHPAVDLSVVYSFFSPEGRKYFFETYGQVDVHTLRLARFKAIYTIVLLFAYGLDQGDYDLVLAAKQGLSMALTDIHDEAL